MLEKKRWFYETCCNKIHKLAKQAIELRKQGEKRYIRWFLKELKLIL